MKKEIISQALNNIESRHIEEAELYSAEAKQNRSFKIRWVKAAAAAAAIICIVGLGIPIVANSIGGFFKDTVRFDGAIVGESYENATEEITVEAIGAATQDGKAVVSLNITLLETESKAPYKYLKGGALDIGDYRLLDAFGKEIYSAIGRQELSSPIEEGKAKLLLPIDSSALSAGESYTLIIESLYGLQKAEQPLKMSGYWECDFVLEFDSDR